MVSQVVTAIFRSDLNDHLVPAHATIAEFEHLASYSWLESELPTILVPGAPPLWSPPMGPLKLEPDCGRVNIDQNAARSPNAPLEPLFRAIGAQKPKFDMGGVDLITDRNNLRKLLRFLGGTSSEPFQMHVEIVGGKRALLTRMENETTTIFQGFRGYGRNFEKAYTKSATGTSGYYRITSFRFCGLHCVVRNETDGYIDDALKRAAAQDQAKTTDSLPQLLETLQLVDSAPVSENKPSITVQREGKEVDCSSIVEIKTRAAGKSLDMNETTAQLWISQTPHLAVGYYKSGLFNDVQVRDMTQNIRDWERSNQKVLCSLGYLLKKIIEVVKGTASQAAVVSYDGGMKLEVIADENKKAMSNAEWQDGKQGTEDKNLMAEKEDQYKTLKQTSTTRPAKTPITIGNVQYEIGDISQIPRLASLGLDSGDNALQSTEIIHEAIPLFDIAIKGIEMGYRQCFRSMSSDITPYRTLCDTYDFLHVDVCKGRTLSEIIKDLKAAQYYDDEEDRDKSKARDAAFKLVYSILQDTFQSNDKHKNTIFNAVLFVVSHPGTFKWKTRTVVRAVYESRFLLSVKQRANLDRWERADADEEDETTEEEDLYFYDSDDSDFW